MPFLPDTVAFHFGANGAPDSWKPRGYLLVGPLFATFILGFVTALRYAYEKPEATGEPPLLEESNKIDLPFWAWIAIYAAIDIAFIGVLAYNLFGISAT